MTKIEEKKGICLKNIVRGLNKSQKTGIYKYVRTDNTNVRIKTKQAHIDFSYQKISWQKNA